MKAANANCQTDELYFSFYPFTLDRFDRPCGEFHITDNTSFMMLFPYIGRLKHCNLVQKMAS